MLEKDFKSKVKIFISSNINDTYVIVRESLKTLLDRTGMCSVYSFEEYPASSNAVDKSYLFKVANSDLVIFLIDNGDAIGEGTLNEYKRSRELNKKCIFIFCDEKNKDKTEIQLEIEKSKKGEKYKTVHERSHVAEEAYLSVLSDVIDIYLMYCSGYINQNSEDDNYPNYKVDDKDDLNDDTIPDKSIYNHSLYLYRKLLKDNIDISDEKHTVNRFEIEAGKMLDYLMGRTHVDSVDFSALKEVISGYFKGKTSVLIKHRLDALESICKGDLDKCIECLFSALDISKNTKKIPNWITNDIAIDIRNISYIKDEYSNIISFNSEGQKEIDCNSEPVYFPNTDRAEKEFFEKSFRQVIKNTTGSPFATSIYNNNPSIEALTNVYISSLLYSSITHLFLIRKKLAEYLQYESFQNKEHDDYILTIKMLLIEGDKKSLDMFINSYGEYTNINEQDINDWANAIERINIEHKKMYSKMLLLYSFGYYFSDEQFENYYNEIKNNMKVWAKDPYYMDNIARLYIELIKKLRYRLNHNELIDAINLFLTNHLERWYDNIFELIAIIPSINIEDEYVDIIYKIIIEYATKEEIRLRCHNINNALLSIRTLLKNDEQKEVIDGIVHEHYKYFYDSTYSLETTSINLQNQSVFIKKQIDIIKDRNKTQGKNGVYSSFATDPYRTIENIISNNNYYLSDVDRKNIIDECVATILSKTQTIDAIISAFELIIVIYMICKDDYIKDKIQFLNNNREDVLAGFAPLFNNGYTKNSLKSVFRLLNYFTGCNNKIEASIFYADLPNCEVSESIIIIQIINKVLEAAVIKVEHSFITNPLFQYLFEMTRHSNSIIRYWAFLNLFLLSRIEKEYLTTVLDLVSEAMDCETYQIKSSLLKEVLKLDFQDSNSKTDFIIQKGKADNHFLVREIAKERI